MKRELFWSNDANGTVRIGNEEIAVECTPSEGRDLAKRLNDALEAFFGEKRPIEQLAEKIGRMTKEEERLVLLVRYAVMYALDHES